MKVIGGRGREQARPCLDLCLSRTRDVVEGSSLVVEVVIGFIAIDHLAPDEVLKADVPSSLGVARILVIIHFISFYLHVCGFNAHCASHMTYRSFYFLG